VWTRRRPRARRARRRPRRGSPVRLVYRLYQRYTSGPQGPARVHGRPADTSPRAASRRSRGSRRPTAACASRRCASRCTRALRARMRGPARHCRRTAKAAGCEREWAFGPGAQLARGAHAPPLWPPRRRRQTGPGRGVSRWRPASNGYSRAGVYLDDDWRSSQRAGRRSPEGSVDAPWGIGGPEARPPSSRAGARPGRVE
jgi:hypothetical protein